MEAISLVRIFDVCVKVCHRISFEEFLNQLQRVLEAASKIFCEFYSNEWAIDPALFCCPLFFPFLLWVSFGVFLGVGSLHNGVGCSVMHAAFPLECYDYVGVGES